MSKYNFDSTFGTYFSDDKPEKKCECGNAENLSVLYTKENGDLAWICQDCKERRAKESQERQAREAARIDEMLWRDEWEE